jgi:hypothetical protein
MAVMTINTIINELQDVPINRLEELYQYIHSLKEKQDIEDKSKMREKILSFAGLFRDWKQDEYQEFLDNTKQIRKDLFNRDVEL